MRLADAKQVWRTDGFVVLPGYLSADDLAPALDELSLCFPTVAGFHEGSDPRRQKFIGDEFSGIDTFAFASVQLSRLAVHDPHRRSGRGDPRHGRRPRLLGRGVGEVHRRRRLRPVAAPRLPQPHDPRTRRVPAGRAVRLPRRRPRRPRAPHLAPRVHTADLRPLPNWHPPADTGLRDDRFVATVGRPDLYAAEVSAAGPAGTVVAFTPDTLHRGTVLTRPGGARFTMHLSFRTTEAEWAQRQGWALVTPTARRQGIGERRLAQVQAWAVQAGLSLVLDVVGPGGGAAIAPYERAGWRQTASATVDWTTPEGHPLTVRYFRPKGRPPAPR